MGLPRAELEQVFASYGEKPFRARQLMRWMYGRGVLDPAAMTDMSLALRERLAVDADFRLPEIDAWQESADGTVKWRLRVGSGQLVETVFIPEEGRGTLCVSSQVGCAINCSFCATGHQGFNRNLGAAEIIAQVNERGFDDLDAPPARLNGAHTPTPYSPTLEAAVVPSHEAIAQAIRDVMAE